MLEETFYGLVDPVDTTIGKALYANSYCVANATHVDEANNHTFTQSLTTLSVANATFWENMWSC